MIRLMPLADHGNPRIRLKIEENNWDEQMATLTTQQKLDDAREKSTKLMSGATRVLVRDGDSMVQYTEANKAGLFAYIGQLENLKKVEEGTKTRRREPAGVIW